MFLRALRQPGQGARHEEGALPAYWAFCTDGGGLGTDWSVLAPEQGLPYYDTDRNEAQSLAAPCNLF